MNRVTTLFVFALTSAGMGLSSASYAQGELSVIAPPTLKVWSGEVFGRIRDHLDYPRPAGPIAPSEGIVSVIFHCSETGAPADVQLYETSRHNNLDRAALRAVRSVATLHPLPRGVNPDQKYIVRILFSTSEERAKAQQAEMQRQAEQHNAWFGRSGATAAAALELVPPNG